MKTFSSGAFAAFSFCLLGLPLFADGTSDNFTYTEDETSVTITGTVEAPEGALKIPAEVVGKPVTTIGEKAFRNLELVTSVTLPEGVTTIGTEAFRRNRLTSVLLPDTLVTIGRLAFAECPRLGDVVIPDSLTNREESSFLGCERLKNATLPANLERIPPHTFQSCTRLEEILIPPTVVTIGHSSFQNCVALKSLKVPSSVTVVSSEAFAHCQGMEKLEFSEGLREIGHAAFKGAPLVEKVTIPASVTFIGANAFRREQKPMKSATFLGDAPAMGRAVFGTKSTTSKFVVYYQEGAEGFTSPLWGIYRAQAVSAGLALGVEQPAGFPLEDGVSKKSFGTVLVGETSGTKGFTITNAGGEALTGISITLDGANPKDFRVDPPNKPGIGPGESRVFKVTFKPKAVGNRGATLHVKTNESAENPFDIKLAGFGAGIR